jgi:hypothetical protein
MDGDRHFSRMSEVADVEPAGRGPSPTSDRPTASAAAPPVNKRDDHARQRQGAGCYRSATLHEHDDYATEWDPRLT